MLCRDSFIKDISTFFFVAVTAFALAMPTPASAKADAETKIGFCARQFVKLREKIYVRYNYLGNGDGIYAPTAESFNKAWQRITPYDLNVNRKYLQYAISERHPQISFLESLGFKIDFENGHIIPSMKQIATRYNASMDTLTANGKLKPEEILRPARMFETKDTAGKQKIIAVALDADPPVGATPINDTLHNDKFWKFIAEGHWPIGEIMHGSDTNISFALHDLGHLGGFLRSPEFMSAVRKFAETRVREGRFEIENNLVNLALESLTLGKASARPKFNQILGALGILKVRTGAKTPAWSVDKFKHELDSIDDTTISKQISDAYHARHEMIEDLGGGRNDSVTSFRSRFRAEAIALKAQSENPKSIIESAYDAKSPGERRSFFARYLATMDHSIDISPAQWMQELTDGDVLKINSPIYQYICTSGAFERTSRFYQMCRLTGPKGPRMKGY